MLLDEYSEPLHGTPHLGDTSSSAQLSSRERNELRSRFNILQLTSGTLIDKNPIIFYFVRTMIRKVWNPSLFVSVQTFQIIIIWVVITDTTRRFFQSRHWHVCTSTIWRYLDIVSQSRHDKFLCFVSTLRPLVL